MRSVLENEMDSIFALYNEKVKMLGLNNMANYTYEQLEKVFTFKYNELFKYTKKINEYFGKTRGQISYAILKLRRLIALWDKEGVIKVEGGVQFADTDKYKSFPIFACQSFNITPTKKTILKLQAKSIDTFIETYNHRIDELKLDHKYKIRNLRDLRYAFKKFKNYDNDTANKLVDIYRHYSSKSDVYSFSKNTNRSF